MHVTIKRDAYLRFDRAYISGTIVHQLTKKITEKA